MELGGRVGLALVQRQDKAKLSKPQRLQVPASATLQGAPRPGRGGVGGRPPLGPVISSQFIRRLRLMIQARVHSANHTGSFCNLGLQISALGC